MATRTVSRTSQAVGIFQHTRRIQIQVYRKVVVGYNTRFANCADARLNELMASGKFFPGI